MEISECPPLIIPWSFLIDTPHASPISPISSSSPSSPTHPKKSFAQILKNTCDTQVLKNTCDISISQLPQPCIKGDAIVVKIPEVDYQYGLQWCKNHLHGRVILAKGDTTFRFADLKSKLRSLWSMIGEWNMISLGRGFYDFSFASLEDMRMVCSVGSWSLKPGILRLSLWSPDFNPNK
ncbi:hypothetical protein Lal_00003418 [Lupinus albus]|nr:hypothetical protein Lal_00003418 [Lupinus albus]